MTHLRAALLSLTLFGLACRATLPVAPHSATLQSAIGHIMEGRLAEAEQIADRSTPGEGALIRLYVAERRHDAAAVHALATGPTGALLRSDRFRLTALARIRYWTEGLIAARDDLKAACDAQGEPDFGVARPNACALAAQAELLAARQPNQVDSTPGEVSLMPKQSLPLALGSMNGRGPGHFIVDTGAPTTVLSSKAAARLKVPTTKDVAEQSSDGGGNMLKLTPAIVDRLAFGNAAVANAACHIIEMPPAFHVAGILAPQQAFPGAAIEFDMRARILRILPGQSAEAWASLIGEPTWSVPVLWVDGNLYVPTQLNGRRSWLLLDSGADANYVCEDIAGKMAESPTGAASVQSFTAAGTLEVKGEVDTPLALAEEPAETTHFRKKPCDRQPRWTNLIPPLHGDGYLGAPWLDGRRVLLSADGRRLFFTARKTPPPPAIPTS